MNKNTFNSKNHSATDNKVRSVSNSISLDDIMNYQDVPQNIDTKEMRGLMSHKQGATLDLHADEDDRQGE